MIVKKRLIYFLIALVVLLLVGNLILDKVNPPKLKIEHKRVSKKLIERKFRGVLYDYGIKNEWIKKIKLKKNKSDSLTYFYKISLSKDLSIPLLISDIKKSLNNYDVTVKSVEEHNYGNSNIDIVNNNVIKLKATLQYKSELKRNSSQLAFILTGVNSLSREDFLSLLNIPYNLGFILLPDAETESMSKEIKRSNKEYYLLLNDDITDERFELNNEFSKGVLSRALNNMFKFYNQSSFFLIDNESDLNNSAVMEYIKSVLRRNKKKYFYIQDFTLLHGESEKDLESLYDFYVLNIKHQETKIFIVSASDFMVLLKRIEKYIHRGNKINFASKILVNKNEK